MLAAGHIALGTGGSQPSKLSATRSVWRHEPWSLSAGLMQRLRHGLVGEPSPSYMSDLLLYKALESYKF